MSSSPSRASQPRARQGQAPAQFVPETEARGAGAGRVPASRGRPCGPQLFRRSGRAGWGPREQRARGWGRWIARLGVFARCRSRPVSCPWRLLGTIPVSLTETRRREGVEQGTRLARREGRVRGPGEVLEGGGRSPPRGAARGLLF